MNSLIPRKPLAFLVFPFLLCTVFVAGALCLTFGWLALGCLSVARSFRSLLILITDVDLVDPFEMMVRSNPLGVNSDGTTR